MSTFETVSITVNVLFALGCVVLARRAYRAKIAAAGDLQIAHEEAHALLQQVDTIRGEYLSLGLSFAESLREIRKDIDRNYLHTHESHLLDRIAYEFEKARRPIRLDDFLAGEIRAVGGAKFIAGDELLFSGGLDLAWHLHSQARRNAGELYVVAQESCGETDRAAWLGKTLALYERICGGDKASAIASLSNVIDHWRYSELGAATRSAAMLEHG